MENSMVLRTENLVKIYGQRTVANNVSINVKQGEIVLPNILFTKGRKKELAIWRKNPLCFEK